MAVRCTTAISIPKHSALKHLKYRQICQMKYFKLKKCFGTILELNMKETCHQVIYFFSQDELKTFGNA